MLLLSSVLVMSQMSFNCAKLLNGSNEMCFAVSELDCRLHSAAVMLLVQPCVLHFAVSFQFFFTFVQ